MENLSSRPVHGREGLGAVARPIRVLPLPGILVKAVPVLAFVALILATNYALTRFPNVKLFDLLVFVAGYTLGVRRGVAVAGLSWLVYGTFNPFGPAGFPLLAVLMASETVYALAGGVVRRLLPPGRLSPTPGAKSLVLGGVAVLTTLAYDVLTNTYTGLAWASLAGSADYWRWVRVALFNPGALFFAAAHTASNLLFFTAFAPLLIKGVERIRGGLR
ncbi:MAG: hypothetical protein HYU29_02245 [Chloroflexi bacterium]|nr:hypothetical protein [Chloroflexota bacterium]